MSLCGACRVRAKCRIVAADGGQAALQKALERLKAKAPNEVTGIDLQARLAAVGATGGAFDNVDESFRTAWSTFIDNAELYRNSSDRFLDAAKDIAVFLHPLESKSHSDYLAARRGIRIAMEGYFESAYGSASTAADARQSFMTKVDSSMLVLRAGAKRNATVVAARALSVRTEPSHVIASSPGLPHATTGPAPH